MLKQLVAAFGIVVLAGAPALAASPIMSGKYLYTWSESCESPSGGYVGTARTTAVATFDSSGGTVGYSGFMAHGVPTTLEPISGTAAFSTTKTTITLDTTVYEAFFSVKKAKVTSVSAIAVVPGDGNAVCSDQVLLTLQ